MDMKQGECMEDLEIKGCVEPFSWTKKKKKCPFSGDLPVFVWFLIKDQSSPILNTHTKKNIIQALETGQLGGLL